MSAITALDDSWTIAKRDLRHWIRQPATVIIGWAFPVLIALMFVGFFGGALEVPDGGTYVEFLLPGMLVMSVVFGLEATMLAVSNDASKGVTDRFRSLPMSSAAVVLGRCVADLLNSVVGLVILAGVGLVLGWRWHHGPLAALGAFALVIALRFALLWVGIFLGLMIKRPESVGIVQVLVWPLGFLSNVFVDPATMPSWLGALAGWNPLSATTSAARELLGNPGFTDGSFGWAIAWPILLTAIFLPLSAWRFRRLSG